MKNRRNILKVGILGLFSVVITACTKAMNGSATPVEVDSATNTSADSATESSERAQLLPSFRV